MRGTRTVLASGFLTLVLITVSSARSAADECLAQPNAPTPQGQHWYYRIDHANDGRQCWYLRPESDRVRKISRQTERDPSEAMAQAMQAPPAPAPGILPEEKHAGPPAAPIPWLNMLKSPEPILSVQPVPQQKPEAQTQPDGPPIPATSGSAVPERMFDPPVAAADRPTPAAVTNPASAQRAREQRRQQAQARPEPPIPVIARVDHTFALLMIMLAALAIAGPALHFVERRRRREAINFRPPPWARVVALNAPVPRIRVKQRPRTASPAGPQKVARPPVPLPIRPPDQTERLAHALQQLIDRLQTTERPEPNAVHARPRGRVSM
jgi:hypothetical protein